MSKLFWAAVLIVAAISVGMIISNSQFISELFNFPQTRALGTHFSATLSLDKQKYAQGEKAILTVKNTGNSTLPYGYPYYLSRKLFFFWVPPIEAPVENTWLTILFEVSPGNHHSQTINLLGFPAGTYGVSKRIGTQWFYTEFVVEGVDQLPIIATVFSLMVILLATILIWRLKPRSIIDSTYQRKE